MSNIFFGMLRLDCRLTDTPYSLRQQQQNDNDESKWDAYPDNDQSDSSPTLKGGIGDDYKG